MDSWVIFVSLTAWRVKLLLFKTNLKSLLSSYTTWLLTLDDHTRFYLGKILHCEYIKHRPPESIWGKTKKTFHEKAPSQIFVRVPNTSLQQNTDEESLSEKDNMSYFLVIAIVVALVIKVSLCNKIYHIL